MQRIPLCVDVRLSSSHPFIPPCPIPTPMQVGVPTDKAQYVHRVGRTARAGKAGRALLVLCDFEQGFLKQVGSLRVGLEVRVAMGFWAVSSMHLEAGLEWLAEALCLPLRACNQHAARVVTNQKWPNKCPCPHPNARVSLPCLLTRSWPTCPSPPLPSCPTSCASRLCRRWTWACAVCLQTPRARPM